MRLNKKPITRPPARNDAMMRQLPMPVQMRIAAPIKQANPDVSPTEPGIKPKKQLLRENIPPSANMDMVAALASEAAVPTVPARWPKAVAPV